MSVSGRTAFNMMERDECKIIVGGVTYKSMAEYRKAMADKKKAQAKAEREKAKAEGRKIVKARKKKKEENEIGIVALTVKGLVDKMTTLKSIQAYKEHAYRQWGTIADEILAHRSISRPMVSYSVQYRELNELIETIGKLSKRNEKAAYQYVQKMVWKLDDMRTNINALVKAVNDTEVCQRFKGHECINGKDRRLGLATILKKCSKTLEQMDTTAKELEEIVKNGTDPLLYGSHLSIRSKGRCWL